MKDLTRKIIFLFMPLAGLLALTALGSCTRVDTLPMLQITVVNGEGEPLKNVLVGLFDGPDQWSMLENPVQPWRETDSYGRVLFNSLKEDIYYFYADADSLSNISTIIKIDEPLRINEIRKLTVTLE